MSIIAVDNVPFKVDLKGIVKMLQKPIRGPFEALNFGKPTQKQNSRMMKTCYLRLSERLDPAQVIQNINQLSFKGKGSISAFIPNHVPNIQIGKSAKSKKNRVPGSMRKMFRDAERIVELTTKEIMLELNAKYPGIVALSAKNNHKLLQDMAKVISDRVKVLVSSSPELEESCFKSTSAYRRAHPHFGDFQLVLSTLHAIQDAAGSPRLQLQESDLAKTHQGPEMPIERVQPLCQKYSMKIAAKMSEHVNSLDTTSQKSDTEEEAARKKIRLELKKLQPFFHQIVHEVVNTQCLPQDMKSQQVRIYGEPYLPNKDTLMPFLRRFKPRRPMRSARMYNLFMLNVPTNLYQQLLNLNGSVLNGTCKLTIVSSELVRSLPWRAGGDDEEEDNDENMAEEEEDQESWD